MHHLSGRLTVTPPPETEPAPPPIFIPRPEIDVTSIDLPDDFLLFDDYASFDEYVEVFTHEMIAMLAEAGIPLSLAFPNGNITLCIGLLDTLAALDVNGNTPITVEMHVNYDDPVNLLAVEVNITVGGEPLYVTDSKRQTEPPLYRRDSIWRLRGGGVYSTMVKKGTVFVRQPLQVYGIN
ncbi:MAG: hypothetical protein FWC16_00950 [Defluviitaleaceae bacterium]|nr:hypothetical protein [Defluviitaleaceae bacterium]MCL2273472.1 hypothetical protein [Defluviitaleaceae bacterium]